MEGGLRPATLGVLGDYSETVIAHRAVPAALALAGAAAGVDVTWRWISTASLVDPALDLAGCDGLWVVPGSPYENTSGTLAAIRWARTRGMPFLGTCGGFQHLLVEFARGVAGDALADHAETRPDGESLVVTRLACSLVEVTGRVRFNSGSLLREAFGADEASEGYHCNYGMNPAWRARLEAAGLRFTAWDDAGEIRGAELPGHPFFAGVLFQPERAALAGRTPALVTAWVRAAARRREQTASTTETGAGGCSVVATSEGSDRGTRPPGAT